MDRRRAAGALLALAACIATTAAAPTLSNQTALDLYDAATEGCYYNFQHYGEGDRIMTNEPCLNCTCHNRMLMCYLRVCPFTKPIGQDCTVEKRADQCCPIVTCPDVPVDLLTSTSTSLPAEYGATGVGKLDKYGCSINGKYFSEGSKVPPTPNKPCEHCYCIRNMTTCVMQECTLHVDGCTPIYHKDVCCPVRYSCDHLEDEVLGLDDMSTTVRPTPGFLLTTTTESPVTQVTQDCVHNDQVFADGTSIKTEKACEHCYCMKGDIVCVVQECGTPMENEGKNCTSQPPREGQCCPDTYICEGDELTTELPSDLSTQALSEELTTLSPPQRTEDEGSGYRNEPDESPHTEISVVEPDVEGSGDELATMQPLDVGEKYTPNIIDDTFGSTEDHGLHTTKLPIEDERTTIELDSELNTVPSGVSEPSVPKLTTLTDEIKSSGEYEIGTTYYEYSTTPFDTLRTTKDSGLHTTESSFRKEDELHVPTDISTLEPIPTKETHEEAEKTKPIAEKEDELHVPTDISTLEPIPTKETHEETEETKPTAEYDTKVTKPSLLDGAQTVTTTESSSSSTSDISKPVIEPGQSSESSYTISEMQTTTIIPEKSESTTINAYENEIEDNSTPQAAGRIPGEGDCLQAGITYRNNSSVPNTNNCQTDCKCISSIIKCDPIICSPPPEYMSNCVPTYDSSESCCPTYVCDGSKETLPPQPHSQMSETESSTLIPTIECHDDQCETQDSKTSSADCTSEDCLIKPSEIPQTSDCEAENCKGIKQTVTQPDMQTDCGPTGCSGETETTDHEPSPVLPVVPESCAECKQEVLITPCEGGNCKTSEGCQNEEDCKNIQDIPKNDTSCEGDDCKEISVDCGDTNCDVSPPIQQSPEICNGEDCKQLEGPVPECTEDECRRKDTADVESKLPTVCTESNCVKPESPDLSVPEIVSSAPEKIPDISVTPELENEVTLSPTTALDQGSDMQTEVSNEMATKVPQTATESFDTESSTDSSKLAEVTTSVSEPAQDEASTEPQSVEIKSTSELPTTMLHDIATEELTDTKTTVSLPQDETMSLDKLTTIPQPTATESHTLMEHEIVKDATKLSTTTESESHVPESSMSTEVGEVVTKVPDISQSDFTSRPYDHSTQIQEDITTHQEDEKLPKDTEQIYTTQSSIKEEADLEKDVGQELATKSPVFATETTGIISDKEPISTTSIPQTEITEKVKLPDVSEIYQITTESSDQYPSDTQSPSDIEEKSSTVYPSIPEEKTDQTEAIKDIADLTTHANEVTSPTILDESMMSKSPDIIETNYEPQTTLSPKESEFTKPQEVDTIKPDTNEPLLSTTTSPKQIISEESDQPTTMTEKESSDISSEPEREEQRTTITPLISLEPEIETEMPSLITDSKDVPLTTEPPFILDEVTKEKLPEVEDKLSTEPLEIYTEEPSIPEEPSVTEHDVFGPESPVEPELPVYIPVHPSTTEEKPEQPEKEIPISEIIPESVPEYISSTTESLEIAPLEPHDVTETQPITDTKEPELDKSDEFTQSPHSELPESDITDVQREREPTITSTRPEAHEMTTESELVYTEEEDTFKTTKVPESFVKDITTPEIIDADTSEKQPPIDKIETEPQVTTMLESVSEPSLSEVSQEGDAPTETQRPEIEIKDTVTKTSEPTTEQYDHSETLPDMIELVEHHPMLDISTVSSVSDEVTTVSYKTTTKYDDEHKLDDTLSTTQPIISEIDYTPTQEKVESETESTEERRTVKPPVTHDYEETFDGAASTKRPDIVEIDHAVTADDESETKRPAFEQPSMPEKESSTDKIDISDIEPQVTHDLEPSTEKSETPENEQEMITKQQSLTEKPETPTVEQDDTRPEQSLDEKETELPVSVTKEPESFETQHTVNPIEEHTSTKLPEMLEMELDKKTTMETPAAVTVYDSSTVEPQTFTSRQEITSKSSEEVTTKDLDSVTEYIISGQEYTTKSEEIESVPEKATSTEKTSDIVPEHEVVPEEGISASETELPTTETKFTLSQEYVTKAPEGDGSDSTVDMDIIASTQGPVSSKTEQEMEKDEELSTARPDTMYTEDEIKPDEKFSTIEPEITDSKHEEKPDTESTIIPETPLDEQKVKPYTESSTEQQEISDIDKEGKPEIDLATQQIITPETDHYVPPKEYPEITSTELTQSQESATEKTEITTNELEGIPEDATEKSEISIDHKDLPEQVSIIKESESPIIDQDVLKGQEPTTQESITSEIGDKETSHKEATERPQTTEPLHKISEQDSATLKPEIPFTDHVLGQDSSTKGPETTKPEYEMKPDIDSSTEIAVTSEKDIFTNPPAKPDIELQFSTEQTEIPEISSQHSTGTSEVPEFEPQSSSEVLELEPQGSTTPSELLDIRPQSSTEQSEISDVEPQSSTERVEITEIEPQSSTERSQEPEVPLQSSTEKSEEPEIEPTSSTERVDVPEIESEHSTERVEIPEIEPHSSTERSELPESESQYSTEPSGILDSKPDSSTKTTDISEVELELSTERTKTPDTESSSEPSELPPSTELSEVPEIDLQASTEPSKVPDIEIKSTELPELEIDKVPSTEKVDSVQEMKPASVTTEPSIELDSDGRVTLDKESSTELSEIGEKVHELEHSTERLDTTEFEYETKPVEGSSTERTETTKYEGKEPEAVVTEHSVVDLHTSTRIPDTSEDENEIKPDSSTERLYTPETTSISPSDVDTKTKPIEDEILVRTTTEIPSSVIYESTTAVDKELPERFTEASVPIDKTTLIVSSPSSSEVQEDSVKQDDDSITSSTTSRYPLKEELTTAVSELEKVPTPEIEIPVHFERDTEKPTESKDTTAPEEEFLAVTTKVTTPKTEEIKPTQSSLYDKFTKPHDKPESELLPSSIAPETPKPGFNEATDEIPSPEDDGHFAPSATGGYGGQEPTDYEDENQPFGPGTCRYGGKVYVSAQQIPRDDPCDFCFCFRSDIICLQQSCPPPIHGCHEEPIQGFCCPRYECPVSMANTLNITTTTTTTTTTLPPHFNLNAYHGAAQRKGCQIKGHTYKVGEVVRASSGPCLHCTCGGDGQMKCDPKACTPEPMLRQMIAAAVSAKRRR